MTLSFKRGLFIVTLTGVISISGEKAGDGDGGTACGVRGVMAAYGDTATP